MTPFCDGPTEKKTLAFLESLPAKASSTNKLSKEKQKTKHTRDGEDIRTLNDDTKTKMVYKRC